VGRQTVMPTEKEKMYELVGDGSKLE
jgi:hypothetical protein